MKRKIKQIVIMTVVILLGLTLLTPLFAMSESEYSKFAKNEEYYQELCKSYSADDKVVCESFSEYKKEKIEKVKGDIKSAENTVAELSGQIVNEEQKLESYHEQIAELELDIASNEKLVTQTEAAISEVEIQIQDRIDRIAELDELIKEYLVNMQGEMRVNGFIEFIMGASDFSDIVRRSEGMKRIKEYNESLINEVIEEQELLREDKENLESKKVQLEDEKELLLVQIEKSKALYEVIDKIVAQLRIEKKDQENLIEQSTEISDAEEQSMKDVFQKIEKAPTPPPVPKASGGSGSVSSGSSSAGTSSSPSTPSSPSSPSAPSSPSGGGSNNAGSGWVYPVSGNFRVGNGVWNYDSGGKHLGQDYPAALGTTLVAPASGVVVKASDAGCSNNFNIYDSCNGGWGNYINMIVNVDGNYYGLLYAHLTPGGISVSRGQQVSAGQAVGQMGSSGMSSGPHLHVEVYYLGQNSSSAFDLYTSNTFGTGGSSSERPGSRCQSNGNSAPCRVNPRSVFP